MQKDHKTAEDEFIKEIEESTQIETIDDVAYVSSKKKPLPMVKELPDWFNLNNYKAAYQLDLEGWINQLFLRIQAEGFLQPIVTKGVVADFRLPEIKKDKQQKSFSPVHNITIFEALRIVESIKHCIQFPPKIWSSPYILQGLEAATFSLLNWFNQKIADKELTGETPLIEKSSVAVNTGIIKVDLSTPDNVLVADFKRWLKEQRGNKKTSNKNYSQAVLRRWATNQVLPYIDLTYWAKLCKVQIPHWLMGEALFPGKQEGDKVDRVRKTTEKNAKEVMTNQCLYGMAAQLAYETDKYLDINNFFYNSSRVETKFRILIPVKE